MFSSNAADGAYVRALRRNMRAWVGDSDADSIRLLNPDSNDLKGDKQAAHPLPMTSEEALRCVESLGKCAADDPVMQAGAVVVACLAKLELREMLRQLDETEKHLAFPFDSNVPAPGPGTPSSIERGVSTRRTFEAERKQIFSELKQKLADCKEVGFSEPK
ncbi:unnamed protein product [Amoebophrya sp. A25]|nr:unnamed protein product [Amoebophrya sp. A25]|eukprot:GSA25T00025273001.1